MSVICQNFVQNAWKKDLCSNCFKSIGDHELSENKPQENGIIETKHLPKNGYLKSSVCSTSPTPQTTWKSLIMNKNEKNNQPFKLETGFQGRLLTINTAVNVFEKKTKASAYVNGHVMKSPTERRGLANGFKAIANVNKNEETVSSDRKTKTDESYRRSDVANTTNGIASCRSSGNKNGFLTDGATKKLAPKCPDSTPKLSTNIQNGNSSAQEENNCKTDDNSSKHDDKKPKDKVTLSKSMQENDAVFNGKENVTLQGILKKSMKDKKKIRRSPGVGFKEEDPVVIGYGGRDFSPEELEWEIASSDGEGGCASLDETEDDKVFSKITKENTKFNSDNINLLQENKHGLKHDEAHSEVNEIVSETGRVSCSDKTQDKSQKIPSVTKNDVQSSCVVNCSQVQENSNMCDITRDIKKTQDRNNALEVKLPQENLLQIETKSDLAKGKRTKDVKLKKSEVPKTQCTEKKLQSEICNGDIPLEKSATLAKESFVDAVSVTTTTTLHVSSDECNTSDTDGASAAPEYGRAVVKNRYRSASQLLGSSVCGDFENETESCAVKAFDEGLTESDRVTNVSSEPVHEAFNTTLAVLQNMDNEDNIVIKHLENNSGKTSCSNGFANSNEIAPLVNDSVEEFADAEETITEDTEKTKCNITPRVSFLHGSGSDYKEPVSDSSAIYSPGSDFFVSRSDSSSSSSSDEQSQKPKLSRVKVNETNDTNYCVTEEIPDGSTDENENENSRSADIKINEENTANNNLEVVIKPESGTSHVTITSIVPNLKTKPEIPAKPQKGSQGFKGSVDSGHYAKPQPTHILASQTYPDTLHSEAGEIYYSSTDAACKVDRPEISEGNHYAEANIYHEINNKIAVEETDESTKEGEARESKLAALAIELEQVRHSNNASSKRQAPSPPKIPDPPHEQPPSSIERPPSTDAPNSVFRSSVVQFSSASSTTSSSSQDDAGFCSWTLHGEEEEPSKSKWKNSFLLSQYSKCKMLAMGYNDGDKTRSKKKFSLKKLLKIGKEADGSLSSDYNPSNRKAWKYSESFDRPRPKLDIIHPMDLENKTLTVNPGFDPSRSSTSSFTSGVEVISIRNSTPSDYGTYYADTMPPEDSRETNYEYVTPQHCHSNTVLVSGEGDSPSSQPSGSTSPTPSRCSAYSQASTLTSGSSKNSSCPTPSGRPPKPPPPPRAHSLQTANKSSKNNPVLYKHSISDDQSSSGGSVLTEESESPLPQAPKRLNRAVIRADYGNYDNLVDTKSCSSLDFTESETGYGSIQVSSSNREESGYEFVGPSYQPQQYEDVDIVPENNSLVGLEEERKENSCESKVLCEKESALKSISTRSRRSPVTKAPLRPPPIYSKLPNGGIVRENAWKTLEASYTALSTNNRDVLIKLIEQGMRKRPFSGMKQKENLQWQNFKLDEASPARFFADGEQVVYDAEMEGNKVTILITLHPQHQSTDLSLSSHLKYPVFAHFYSNIPSHLLLEDGATDLELDNVQTSIYVLYRAEVISLENYICSLPDSLSDHSEKELAYILLQVIQELKGLQVQGIEEVEPSFNTLLLAKTAGDLYYSLVFRSGDFYEDSGNAYSLMLEDCKLSLCQYALLLIFQLLKVESLEELSAIGVLKFTKSSSIKVFENVATLLSEEKAVSLSQAKTLLECFIWGVQQFIAKPDFDTNEADILLHRWIDLERSNFIRHMVYNPQLCINMHLELHSQFLIRCNIRNIKDVLPLL